MDLEDKEFFHSSTLVLPIIAAATKVMAKDKPLHSSAMFIAYSSISRQTWLSLKAIVLNKFHASSLGSGCTDSCALMAGIRILFTIR